MTRDTASKSWRPFGYWALTINVAFGFVTLVILAVLGIDIGVLAGSYASLLAAWCAAAGIRQWGKHNNEDE